MIYFDRQIEDVRVAVWHMTEDYDEILSLLPDADLVKNEAESRFKSQRRIMEWTTVRVLLYMVLGRQVNILYNEQGAPSLPDYEGLNISISHTKEYVAIALSEKSKVGIDVEYIEHDATDNDGKPPRVVRVKDRFVRSDEFADNHISMLLHWSAKETVFKVLGREKVNFINDLKVSPFDDTVYEGTFELEDLKRHDTYTIMYKVFDDFVLTITRQEE